MLENQKKISMINDRLNIYEKQIYHLVNSGASKNEINNVELIIKALKQHLLTISQ